jgi:hypothetical protein
MRPTRFRAFSDAPREGGAVSDLKNVGNEGKTVFPKTDSWRFDWPVSSFKQALPARGIYDGKTLITAIACSLLKRTHFTAVVTIFQSRMLK